MKIDWHSRPEFGQITFSKYPNKNPLDKNPYVHIHMIIAPTERKGFGTKAIGYIIANTLQEGYTHFELDASYSSHLFHLYMGFSPKAQGDISYIRYWYGIRGEKAINKIREGHIDDLSERDLQELTAIYEDANQINEGPTLEIEQIKSLKNELIALEQKKLPWIEYKFIPTLLDFLKNYSQDKSKNSGDYFGSVPMILSEAGLARWKEAIETGAPFKPFYDLSHLHTDMSLTLPEEHDETKSLILKYLTSIHNRSHPTSTYLIQQSALFKTTPIKESGEESTQTKGPDNIG
ncbi:TPA: hypothetical protein JAN60_07570 [Legionella pneumophila]|uniref:hypothetical protein n=1 Tax=Legionella pneumophila TaxID=446 RepID=UPI0010AADCDB|nr:hypothetical protein [Legionella pneumophila]TIG67089.1 hypothetical protein DI132_04275 [Legionella pneumophila]TIG72974.1 hypothetical protein DI104_05675 [Legionella pneumophila]HAT3863344.1 hypothetical protein [Legionella pneumophila]HAT3872677.1 hypothetical protein [Legionella pneumophila]HAT7047779.1 hypothetical protein [Legionella pneumophila]